MTEGDLGMVRYCLIRESISKKHGKTVPIAQLKWTEDTEDVPERGPKERRVEVKMYLHATNCT